jgi:hypothetical protein
VQITYIALALLLSIQVWKKHHTDWLKYIYVLITNSWSAPTSTLMLETEQVLETLVCNWTLMQLIAWGDFSAFIHYEIIKFYRDVYFFQDVFFFYSVSSLGNMNLQIKRPFNIYFQITFLANILRNEWEVRRVLSSGMWCWVGWQKFTSIL